MCFVSSESGISVRFTYDNCCNYLIYIILSLLYGTNIRHFLTNSHTFLLISIRFRDNILPLIITSYPNHYVAKNLTYGNTNVKCLL